MIFFCASVLPLHSQWPAPQGRIAQEAASVQSSPIQNERQKTRPSSITADSYDGELDIGEQQLVVSKESFQTLGVYLSTNLFYVDNAALSPFQKYDDWGWNSSLTLQWNPKIYGDLFLDVLLREDFYRYDRFKDVLDFDSFRSTVGFMYFLPKLQNSFVFAKYQVQLTTLPLDWDEALYENHSILTGLQKVYYFSKGNQLHFQLGSEFSFDSDPELLKRNEYSFQVQHLIRWSPRIQSSLVYRIAYQDYVNLSEMSSWNHVISGRLQYSVAKWMQVGLSATVIDNQASDSRFNYEMFTASFMLDLQFRF